jgi:hypothetical protein
VEHAGVEYRRIGVGLLQSGKAHELPKSANKRRIVLLRIGCVAGLYSCPHHTTTWMGSRSTPGELSDWPGICTNRGPAHHDNAPTRRHQPEAIW